MRVLGAWHDSSCVRDGMVLEDRDGRLLALAYPLARGSIVWEWSIYGSPRMPPMDQGVMVATDRDDIEHDLEERLVRAGICGYRAVSDEVRT